MFSFLFDFALREPRNVISLVLLNWWKGTFDAHGRILNFGDSGCLWWYNLLNGLKIVRNALDQQCNIEQRWNCKITTPEFYVQTYQIMQLAVYPLFCTKLVELKMLQGIQTRYFLNRITISSLLPLSLPTKCFIHSHNSKKYFNLYHYYDIAYSNPLGYRKSNCRFKLQIHCCWCFCPWTDASGGMGCSSA